MKKMQINRKRNQFSSGQCKINDMER